LTRQFQSQKPFSIGLTLFSKVEASNFPSCLNDVFCHFGWVDTFKLLQVSEQSRLKKQQQPVLNINSHGLTAFNTYLIGSIVDNNKQ
jgi:hypothetical protein